MIAFFWLSFFRPSRIIRSHGKYRLSHLSLLEERTDRNWAWRLRGFECFLLARVGLCTCNQLMTRKARLRDTREIRPKRDGRCGTVSKSSCGVSRGKQVVCHDWLDYGDGDPLAYAWFLPSTHPPHPPHPCPVQSGESQNLKKEATGHTQAGGAPLVPGLPPPAELRSREPCLTPSLPPGEGDVWYFPGCYYYFKQYEST